MVVTGDHFFILWVGSTVTSVFALLILPIFSYFYESRWRAIKAKDCEQGNLFDHVFTELPTPTTPVEWLRDFCIRFVRCAQLMPVLFMAFLDGLARGMLAIGKGLGAALSILAVVWIVVFPIYGLVQRFVFDIHYPNENQIWLWLLVPIIYALVIIRGNPPYITGETEDGKRFKIWKHRFW